MKDKPFSRLVVISAMILLFCSFYYIYRELGSKIDQIAEETGHLAERVDLIDAETRSNNAAEEAEASDLSSSRIYADLTFSECIFGNTGNYQWLILKKQ